MVYILIQQRVILVTLVYLVVVVVIVVVIQEIVERDNQNKMNWDF